MIGVTAMDMQLDVISQHRQIYFFKEKTNVFLDLQVRFLLLKGKIQSNNLCLGFARNKFINQF